ncbi:GGDEF domain-containing protein [Photobacterium sp. BZF1]|uniref:sensor domain-containing diguanylate cyclase n=1 Tax=Photobacterium sp. BZF1 TaxID=1904457 RepID=UPI001653BDF5|nr:sensor domain-containing diguanylate cyclase [Photobacterium sp. BZF1]MBC7005102.1 GGDEF domain-containing protein [Photobacterium sp. BZF1]
MKVQPRLLISIIFPLVISVLSLLIYVGYSEYKNNQNAAISQATSNVRIAREYLEHHFHSAQSHLYLLEQLWEEKNSIDGLMGAAQTIVSEKSKYLEVGLLAYGNYYGTDGFYREAVAQKVAKRPWYMPARTGQNYITPMYLSGSTGKWTVAFVAVLEAVKQQEVRIILEVDVESLYDNLSLLKTLDHGYVYAVERGTGNIVMHPDPSRIGTPSVSVSRDLLAAIEKGKGAGIISSYEYKDKEKFSVYEVNDLHNWIVLSGAAKSEIIMHTFSISAVTLSLLVFILIIGLSFYIIHRVHIYGRQLSEVESLPELLDALKQMVEGVIGCQSIHLYMRNVYSGDFESAQCKHCISEKELRLNLASKLGRLAKLPEKQPDILSAFLAPGKACIRVPLTKNKQLIGLLYITSPRLELPFFINMLRTYAQGALGHVMLALRIQQTDAMTGLRNKNYLQAQIEKQIKAEAKCYVAMIDIDDFKIINDSYGHLFGDQVITSVANCLREESDRHAVVARYGGEEFAILLPAKDLLAAKAKLESIRSSVSGVEITDGRKSCRVHVSIGVAEVSGNMEKSIARADQALYQAKANGKNQVVIYCLNSMLQTTFAE